MKASLAGGCFWCIESAFRKVVGILSTRSGYMGGTVPDPTYEEVCQGNTGHVEAVEIDFDPERITFLQILDIYWHQIDPIDATGQFSDRGSSYQTVIFYHDEKQRKLAEKSKASVQKWFDKPIATKILPAQPFYPAEAHHQNYCTKQSKLYQLYREGHEKQLQQLWHDKPPIKEDLKEKLTPLQYQVTQQEGTEPPFKNEYWDNKEEGIYVDVVSGEPLFASTDKFDSGTGWPSFTRPIRSEILVEQEDWKLGSLRTEVRGRLSQSHLGHLFPDGPPPTGIRYCINSAALRFIPKDKMKEEGYGDYLSLFG